jgi:hypothetical protein
MWAEKEATEAKGELMGPTPEVPVETVAMAATGAAVEAAVA